jgi:hypothetical protein
MAEEDRWAKLEEIVRKVVREEVAALKSNKKTKVRFVGGKWQVTPEEMEMFREAYPAVDIEKEMKEAAVWIVMNPGKAPVSDYGAFLQRWFKTNQNQASLRSIPHERPTEVRQKLCGYCGKNSTGNVNGIPYCDEHSLDAMDMKPRRMLGVVAKPVAGRD